MEIIQIKASAFFELLKMRDTSIWEVFAQMIGEKEKEIIFLDDEEKVILDYVLPDKLGQLNKDREKFSKEYSEKISGLN